MQRLREIVRKINDLRNRDYRKKKEIFCSLYLDLRDFFPFKWEEISAPYFSKINIPGINIKSRINIAVTYQSLITNQSFITSPSNTLSLQKNYHKYSIT